MSSIRAIHAVVLSALCLSGANAFASDYAVSYAFDAGDINDWGKATCEYTSFCKIDSRRTNLSISLAFWDPSHREMTISVSGQDSRWDCCYFSDGADTTKRKVTSPIRLYVYGRRRPRDEHLFTEPLGILYLQFLEMK